MSTINMKKMKMYSKYGLLVAIALAAILGVGCRRGEPSAVAGGLDLKQKRDKVVELFSGQCTACGIPEEKIKNYRPQIEESLDEAVRLCVESASDMCDKNDRRIAMSDDSRREKFISEAASRMKLKVKQIAGGVKTREELEARIMELTSSLSSVDDNGVASVLDDLGISDSVLNSLLHEVLQGEFLDKFLYSFLDLVASTLRY